MERQMDAHTHSILAPDNGAQSYLSPGLRSGTGSNSQIALEFKFLLPMERAESIRERALRELTRDPYADAQTGSYDVCSLYLDTQQFDILRRSPEYRGVKYRFRRYGNSPKLFLERKARDQKIVSKQRDALDVHLLHANIANMSEHSPSEQKPTVWDSVMTQQLLPACAVRYRRDAFYSVSEKEYLRVTVDNDLQSILFRHRTWSELVDYIALTDTTQTIEDQRSRFLFSDWAVVEFKFMDSLPLRFKQWIEDFQLTPMKFSKYRSAMVAANDE